MENELKIECPLCHAQPGTPCGNQSHPERVEAFQAQRKPVAKKRPHVVAKKKHRRAA